MSRSHRSVTQGLPASCICLTTVLIYWGCLLRPVFTFPGISPRPPIGLWGVSCSYRFGLGSLFIGGLSTVFLAVGPLRSRLPVDNNLALLALVFRVAEAALIGTVSIFNFSALKLYIDADCLWCKSALALVPIICLGSLPSPPHAKMLQLGWIPTLGRGRRSQLRKCMLSRS
jgi:hypothetical protein